MAEFSRKELQELLAQETGPFVTMMMPVFQTGSDQHQNTTRLKNLLREAEQMLNTLNRTVPMDARTFLSPAQDLLDSENLFQQSGLVMFLSADPDNFRCYQVDIELGEKVVVGDWFYIRPLLPLLTGNESFYVLTLSQNQTHLL